MKILNFGSINIDIVYTIPHIVRPGETLSSLGSTINAGGKGANQSIALARAGVDVWHAGKIGYDGTWVLKLMQDNGINTDLVQLYDGPTGKAIIQLTPEGTNSIILEGGGNRSISSADIDNALKPFNQHDYLIVQNEINNMPEILYKASNKKMKIYLNPAPFSEDVTHWPIELVHTLIVNEIEARELSGIVGDYETLVNAMTAKYPDVQVILTAGKDGSYFGVGNYRYYEPAVKVPVIDTTAAGDTYFGYFIASILMGKSVPQAMKQASAAAGVSVTRSGAISSIPNIDEMD